MIEALPQIVTFLLVLIFAHFALSRWKLHRFVVLWRLVEYLWLATAALGIVAIANEVKRADATADVEAKEQAVRLAYMKAFDMARGGELFDGGNQAMNLARGDRVASWYRYLVESLELGYESGRWSHFLAQNADLEFGPPRAGESRVPQFPPKGWLRLDLTKEDPDTLEQARLRLQMLRLLSDARGAWYAAQSALAASAARRNLRNFRELVSWIVAIALALRIAKVQADRLRTDSTGGDPTKPSSAESSEAHEASVAEAVPVDETVVGSE